MYISFIHEEVGDSDGVTKCSFNWQGFYKRVIANQRRMCDDGDWQRTMENVPPLTIHRDKRARITTFEDMT